MFTLIRGMSNNAELSDRNINLKLEILVFLTSAGRCHETCDLHIKFMVRTANSFKFFSKKVTKSWRKGKPPPCWEFHEYSDNEKLCAVVCIAEYLGRSASWHTQGQNQLLLGHIKPYKEVQSSTIADWVKLVLKMVGIDTSLYKAHSCRSASTSKPTVLGTSLKDILKRGQWSGASNWQRHYNRKMVNRRKSSEFETVIFTNALN